MVRPPPARRRGSSRGWCLLGCSGPGTGAGGPAYLSARVSRSLEPRAGANRRGSGCQETCREVVSCLSLQPQRPAQRGSLFALKRPCCVLSAAVSLSLSRSGRAVCLPAAQPAGGAGPRHVQTQRLLLVFAGPRGASVASAHLVGPFSFRRGAGCHRQGLLCARPLPGTSHYSLALTLGCDGGSGLPGRKCGAGHSEWRCPDGSEGRAHTGSPGQDGRGEAGLAPTGLTAALAVVPAPALCSTGAGFPAQHFLQGGTRCEVAWAASSAVRPLGPILPAAPAGQTSGGWGWGRQH